MLRLSARSICLSRGSIGRGFSTSSSIRSQGPFKVLFCGSDEFSVGSLSAVVKAKDVWSSIHVLTPGVQNIGRGGKSSKRSSKVYKPALLTFAEENEIPYTVMTDVISKRLNGEPSTGSEAEWKAPSPFDTLDDSHMLLTASFGHIIPNAFLESFVPAHRLNVHPSLLPKYRGAAPLQWTILNGDQTTGISIQRLVSRGQGIDAGEIVGRKEGIPVAPEATFASLISQFGPLGGELLVETLREIIAGKSVATPQDASQKTRAPKVRKESSQIDWKTHSSTQIDRMHRALHHNYPLWTVLRDHSIQFLDARRVEAEDVPPQIVDRTSAPGTAAIDKSKGVQRMLLACASSEEEASRASEAAQLSWLEVQNVKPEGKKAMPVKEWWNGLPSAERKENRVQFGA